MDTVDAVSMPASPVPRRPLSRRPATRGSVAASASSSPPPAAAVRPDRTMSSSKKHQQLTQLLPDVTSMSPATPAPKGRVSAHLHGAQLRGTEAEDAAATSEPLPHAGNRTDAVCCAAGVDGCGNDSGGNTGGSSGGASEDPSGGNSGVGTQRDAHGDRTRRTCARLQNHHAAAIAAAAPLDPQTAAAEPPLPLPLQPPTTGSNRSTKRSSQTRRTDRSSSGEMAAPQLKRRQRLGRAAACASAAATAKDDDVVMSAAGPKCRVNTSAVREENEGGKEAAAAAEAAEEEEDKEEEHEEEEVGKARRRKALKEKKPPRRSKAILQEEIRAAAARGIFAQHVTLHDLYPHSRSYGPGPVPLSPAALALAMDGNARLAAAAAAAAAAAGTGANATQIAAGGDGSNNGGLSNAGSSSYSRADESGLPSGSAGQVRGRRRRGRNQSKVTAGAADTGGSGEDDATAAATAAAVTAAPSQPPVIVRPMPSIVPNLGYACLCATLREHDIFASRDTNKAGFQTRGLEHVSKLAHANAKDLRPLIEWNEAHGIRLFRLSSGIFPWMSFYQLEELQDADAIKQALADAGAAARRYGHRITFHPSEFTKIASDKPEVVETSIKELEVHSRILDLMGFLPATPFNKINIHVGGVYGNKTASMDRFAKVVLERLSPNCRSRLTVENDDKPSLYSVRDLIYLANKAHIPIVFDFHHHRFCTGELSEEEAFHQALSTWPRGVRPIVHWSESQEGRRANAHSDYVSGPINLYGMEQEVDVMIESKAKELALLHYREAALTGQRAERPPPMKGVPASDV